LIPFLSATAAASFPPSDTTGVPFVLPPFAFTPKDDDESASKDSNPVA
jgi:hypothetical protein